MLELTLAAIAVGLVAAISAAAAHAGSAPGSGGLAIAPATTWIYIGNALVAAAIAVAGLFVAVSGRAED
jgi:hypothetical protein